MKTRVDLQPWIVERCNEAAGIPALSGAYLDGMSQSLMDRNMSSLASHAFSYALAHGVDANRVTRMCEAITMSKGIGYASSDDFLANFYRVGRREGIPAISALAVYVWKHFDWLSTYERTGVAHGSEGLDSRLADVVLYAALGRAIQLREAEVRDASPVSQGRKGPEMKGVPRD